MIVVQPNGANFGHLGVELLTAFAEARSSHSGVVLIEPSVLTNRALFSLQPEDVRVRRWPAWTAVAALSPQRAARARVAAGLAVRRGVDLVRDEAADAVRWHLGHTPMLPAMRAHLRSLKSALGHRGGPPRAYIRSRQTYFRRQLLRTPLPVSLPPSIAQRAAAQAQALGIAPDRPLALIHARESGFKGAGREVQHKHAAAGSAGVRDDSCRNGSIADYREAVDLLLARGFTVARIGDPTMAPLPWREVIDLAPVSGDDGALQVYCLLRSHLLVAGEAGPSAVALITNTPVLTVNGTDPIGSYPIRRDGLLLLKTVRRRDTGHHLSPFELLDDDYYEHLRDTAAFEYIDNTPGEIAGAVAEMLARLEARPESARQVAFRDAATQAAERLRDRFAYVRKWGTDGGFLGDGAIVADAVA